tara:strand:+ start:106 stop:408 length:303 start_codon:yes stop_codon:yes gene_type:complete
MSKDNIIQFPTDRINTNSPVDVTNEDWWHDIDLSDVPSDDAEVIMLMRTLHNITSIVTDAMLDDKDYDIFYHAKFTLDKLLKEIIDRDLIDFNDPDGDFD